MIHHRVYSTDIRQFRRGFRDAFDDVTGCVSGMASDKTNLV